jgi:hypothetical protein
MKQIAWIFTHWSLVNGGYVPALAASLQEGESLTCARDFWMYGTPLARHMLVVRGVAEEARINLLNGSVHFVIATVWEDESNQTPTNRAPSTPLSAAEVTALSTYLTTKTGLTNTQIAAWFGLTPAQLSTWLQSNPRSEAVARMLQAWHEWRN